MPTARHYLTHATAALTSLKATANRPPNEFAVLREEADWAIRMATATALVEIAEYLAPETRVMEAPPDPTEFGMAVCVLKGSHDPFQAHTLIECPTYGPPSVDPWTKAVPVSDADKRS